MRWFSITLAFIILLITAGSGSCKIVIANFSLASGIIVQGDTTEGYIEIKNDGNSIVFVRDITLLFDESIVSISPNYFQDIGNLAPSSSSKIWFTVTAKRVGDARLSVVIRAEDGSEKYSLSLIVKEVSLKIVTNKTIVLNEVNTVPFSIISSIKIENVVVEPLFEAEPKKIYMQNFHGSFTFLPKSPDILKFKVSYYVNKKYHETICELAPKYRESLGIGVNVSVGYFNMYLSDTAEIRFTFTNLRSDRIYSIKILPVSKEGVFYPENVEIPVIKPEESVFVNFLYSSKIPGRNTLVFDVCYKDAFNNAYYFTRELYLHVINKTQLILTDIETETFPNVKIKGKIVNFGKSVAQNVLIRTDVEDKKIFLGNIEPSSYENFEIKFELNISKATVYVSWNNKIGDTYELKKVVEFSTHKPPKPKSPIFITAALVFSLGIFAIMSAVWVKRFWKKRK